MFSLLKYASYMYTNKHVDANIELIQKHCLRVARKKSGDLEKKIKLIFKKNLNKVTNIDNKTLEKQKRRYFKTFLTTTVKTFRMYRIQLTFRYK